MAIDERDRHRLHQRLDDVLGVAEAATLMSHLPPVGWLDVTTNQQLSALEGRMDARFKSLEGRMDARFETVDARLDVVRHDFGEQLALGLRDQLRVLVFTFVACMLTFASVVIAAMKL